MLLAHISDLHIDGSERAVRRAARVLRQLGELAVAPDALIVSGDLADHGGEEEYRLVTGLLADSPSPVLICPGNHDARAALRATVLGEPVLGTPDDHRPVNRTGRVGELTVLLADSTIPGRPEGHLDDPTLEWLDAELAEAGEGPVLLVMHHPPAALHHPALDDVRQHGEHRLAELLSRHPPVAGLLCGHAHTAAAGVFAGAPLRVAPGVTSTLVLPWERPGAVFDTDAPPGVAYHVWSADRLTTHFRVV
ncbi:phosphodiesterase [Pseudonocardia sp. K10HN5]|uniref:Phosphodiesterase n=1 Tax=Pseudonocardia acidicola TaxID=2724939 RepID=A0ABX1S6K5_9PSEU|nr:metallophosphoesterase [Pseudonocardia acidicola]NMH97175.1 phosphodiesterase [Pseudonocardia acidicola]